MITIQRQMTHKIGTKTWKFQFVDNYSQVEYHQLSIINGWGFVEKYPDG
jgi:hypothetical protein